MEDLCVTPFLWLPNYQDYIQNSLVLLTDGVSCKLLFVKNDEKQNILLKNIEKNQNAKCMAESIHDLDCGKSFVW